MHLFAANTVGTANGWCRWILLQGTASGLDEENQPYHPTSPSPLHRTPLHRSPPYHLTTSPPHPTTPPRQAHLTGPHLTNPTLPPYHVTTSPPHLTITPYHLAPLIRQFKGTGKSGKGVTVVPVKGAEMERS